MYEGKKKVVPVLIKTGVSEQRKKDGKGIPNTAI